VGILLGGLDLAAGAFTPEKSKSHEDVPGKKSKGETGKKETTCRTDD